MKLDCFYRGHWWAPEHRYEVPLVDANPRSEAEIIGTYARRECIRCGKQDSITISERRAS